MSLWSAKVGIIWELSKFIWFFAQFIYKIHSRNRPYCVLFING